MRYPRLKRTNLQDYFPATNACPMKQKLGREPRTGDHGKWVCGVKTLLQRPGCIVYSIGSDGLTGQPSVYGIAPMHAALAAAATHMHSFTWETGSLQFLSQEAALGHILSALHESC